jgi:hypothetical protein
MEVSMDIMSFKTISPRYVSMSVVKNTKYTTLRISEVVNAGYKKLVLKWIFEKIKLLIKAIIVFVECEEKQYQIYGLRILFIYLLVHTLFLIQLSFHSVAQII